MKPLLIIILLAITVGAQSPTQPSPEQKAQLKQLAQTAERKQQEADSAKDKYLIALLAIWAELGLKPSETTVSWDSGEATFKRVEKAPEPKKKDSP